MTVRCELAASALTDLLFDEPAIGRCLVAPDGSVVRVNAEWLRSTGYTAEQVLGEDIVGLFPETRDLALALHARARAGHRVVVPPHAQRVHGRESWWEGSIAPVPMDGGTGLLITAREAGGGRPGEQALRQDLTEPTRTEQALRESEERYRTLTDAMPQIVCALGWDGTPEYVNSSWTAFSGLDLAASARAGWQGVLHPDDLPVAAAVWERAREQRAAQDAELRYRAADGSHRWFLCRLVPVADASGRVVRFVGAGTDIDGRKRAEAERERLVAELRDADRQKDEFIGMLSHELRNPLAPIRNSVYILEHPQVTREQAAHARAVIQRQAEHLAHLVDDLLDVTRVSRGKLDLRRARVDLREVARRAADDFGLVMQARGLAFRAALPERELWVDADATRMAQVVGNLLHNAAKFSRRGDEVSLSLREVGGAAELRVRDTGAGIDPALLPRVFEPFVQGDRTLARTEGGLGLGLALVKGIAELHGGTARAESAGKGRGAELVVLIPLGGAGAARRGQPAGPRPAAAVRRVLVVDDNRDGAESLAQIVELLGHQADIAYDGPAALEKVRASPPDVVLCDLGLPGMSGYEVAKALRASAPHRLQLVAVSGYAQPDDVRAALAAGFDRHVAKPASVEELERLLR